MTNLVTRPIIVKNGDTFDGEYRVEHDSFEWSSVAAVFYLGNAHDVTFGRDFSLVTDQERWRPEWTGWSPAGEKSGKGIPGNLAGIRISGPDNRNLKVLGARVQGFPGAAVTATGLHGAEFDRVDVHLCGNGIHIAYNNPSEDVAITRYRGGDLWRGMTPDTTEPWMSERYPGQGIGGTHLGLQVIQGLLVQDADMRAEASGFKVIQCAHSVVRNVLTSQFMSQGSPFGHARPDDVNEDMDIEGLVIDKTSSPVSRKSGVNGWQCSGPHRDVSMRRSVLIGSGTDGHAIQLWGGANVDVTDSTFIGWQGERGGKRAAGLHRASDDCAVNFDFSTANRFHHMSRIYADEF